MIISDNDNIGAGGLIERVLELETNTDFVELKQSTITFIYLHLYAGSSIVYLQPKI